MELLLFIIGVVVVAIPIALLVALVRIGNLGRRVRSLEGGIEQLRRQIDAGIAAPSYRTPPPDRAEQPQPSDNVAPAASGSSASPASVDADSGIVVDDDHDETPDPVAAEPSTDTRPDHGGSDTAGPDGQAPDAGWWSDDRGAAGSGRPSPATWLAQASWRWLTEGNVPVKVGMLVLFAGVAALLKYVADQGWLTLPIELRLAGIGAAAIAGLAFGWRQREQRRSFALSLQGGAIGVLLMTIFAAFKLYGLLPGVVAFALSVVLVVGCGVLALAQNARALAILGILAGFLSPILMSTGQGSHVALFSWYALLNAAIFAIAWLRSWRELNLIGFVFTFGVGVVWGALDYRPEYFASTAPFLAVFFVFYLAIPILNARRQGHARRELIDGSLVFGNPLLSFALLAGMLDARPMPLAFAALGVAALYALLAWRLLPHGGYRTLTLAFAVLAVGFATLAVPLALSASATACVFALEGAALIWLGLRQDQYLPRWAGTALQGLAALAWGSATAGDVPDYAVANAPFLGGAMIALAGLASAFFLHRARLLQPALLFYLWGLWWWLAIAGNEIETHAAPALRPDLWLGLMAVSVALAGAALARIPTAILAWTIVAGHAAAVAIVPWQAQAHEHPFAGWGWLAWFAYAVLGLLSLRALRRRDDDSAPLALAAWWLAWALALSLGLYWLTTASVVASGLGEGWRAAATALPWLLLAGLMHRWPAWTSWPLSDAFARRQPLFLATAAVVMGLIWLVLQSRAGAATPLPWLPLLNPLELGLVASLGLLLALLWHPEQAPQWQRGRWAVLVGAGFLTITSLTLRSVHHLGGVPWNDAMAHSALAQASLSLVWSALGVVGWIAGSRRGNRALWMAGAVLMAVVLAKLVLIDRQHLGNLLGIVSFIGYGLLCTAVGYFAPAPPKPADAVPDARNDGVVT